MLDKYKKIIYKDKNAEKEVIDSCIKYVVGLYPNIEVHDVMTSIVSGGNNDIK